MDDPIVGIRFVEAGPVSYCRPGNLRLGIGDYVVVRTDRGERLGWVVIEPDQVLAAEHKGPMRVVERLATENDVAAHRRQRERAQEDITRAQGVATRSDPRIRVASLEYDLAGERGDLTFSAPERVEHDWLRRQVADLLGCDLEVQQVGDRDRAKAAGGLGVCGLALCCSTWMTEFPAISIKMAKDQDLAPNPSKISGVCGRLLCCLSYEVETYRELRGQLPKVGKRVTTPVGRAKVLNLNVLSGIARLRLDATGEIVEMTTEELKSQYGTAVRPEELDAVVEQPIRERQARLDRDLVAVMTPVSAPARTVASNGDTPEDLDAPPFAENGASEDGEPRRRRRGRRGGRRRRRADGGEGGEGGASEDGGTE